MSDLIAGVLIGMVFAVSSLALGAYLAWRFLPARLDGSRQSVAPSSQQTPYEPRPETVEATKGPGFTPETIRNVENGLRDQYVAAGVPVPSASDLRAQAMRALMGFDI